jgi:hypothetical protein
MILRLRHIARCIIVATLTTLLPASLHAADAPHNHSGEGNGQNSDQVILQVTQYCLGMCDPRSATTLLIRLRANGSAQVQGWKHGEYAIRDCSLSHDELTSLLRLLTSSDFRRLLPHYAKLEMYTDTASKMKIEFNYKGRTKMTQVDNYDPDHRKARKHYSAVLIWVLELVERLNQQCLIRS